MNNQVCNLYETFRSNSVPRLFMLLVINFEPAKRKRNDFYLMNQYNGKLVKEPGKTQPLLPRDGSTVGRGSFILQPQEEGKMAAPNKQSDGFLDLNELRNNSLPSHIKVKYNVGKQTVLQPSEDVNDFKSLNQATCISAIVPTQKRPTFLPAPTFRSTEKILVPGKDVSCQQNQPSETVLDGTQLPFFDAKAEELGVQLRKDPNEAPKPASTYTEGEIKYTTKQALKTMTEDLHRLNCRVTTGCIVDETCDPELNAYMKGIHFVTDKPMGRGAYGTVDLCYDSETVKPFIRKQLRKNDLRTSEIIVPLTLSHYNVTKFFGLIQKWDEEGNPIMELLMEYGGCALNKYMLEVKSLPTEQIWDLSKQGLEALSYISLYSIVHMDVKPQNICVMKTVNGSLLLKLTDFGSSRRPQEPLEFSGVTPEYMAPEMCEILLQRQGHCNRRRLTEADITGKVDTFAFALVIMYLYKRYHILKKLIDRISMVERVDVSTRELRHLHLMTMMVDNSLGHSLVQTLIPDECDLDMRDLLVKLTEHNHKDRFSAREGLDFIDSIAEYCMERDNGPVKNRTKDALRLKLQPYGKSGKKGKNGKSLNGGKTASAKESISEMWELKQGIASKQIPMTPVNKLEALNMGHCPKPVMENNIKTAVTERRAPVVQASMDTPSCPSHLSQPVMPAFGFNSVNRPQVVGAPFGFSGINTSQPLQQAPGFSFTIPCQQPENNVVSLGGKSIPQAGAGVMLLDIPQELIQRLLLMKAAKQAKMTMDTRVQPKAVSQIPTRPREQTVKIGQTKNIAAFDDSPVQMEADDGTGDDGNLPKFSMFVLNKDKEC